MTGLSPKIVLFVDDKWDQVVDVHTAMKKLGIECKGIRFGKADERVAAFDGKVADLQWCHLPTILTDENAYSLLRQRD